jgi:hypothetical protein
MYQSNLIGKITGQPLPGEMDPSRRVRAWKETSAAVEAAREKLAAEGKPAFIIADHYGMTALFTFYLPQAHDALKTQPLVYPIDLDRPNNQLYFWPEYRYDHFRQGQNAIYVSEPNLYPLESGWVWKWLQHEPVHYGDLPPPPILPPNIAQDFESVTDLGDCEVKLGPRMFRRVHLWACYNLK